MTTAEQVHKTQPTDRRMGHHGTRCLLAQKMGRRRIRIPRVPATLGGFPLASIIQPTPFMTTLVQRRASRLQRPARLTRREGAAEPRRSSRTGNGPTHTVVVGRKLAAALGGWFQGLRDWSQDKPASRLRIVVARHSQEAGTRKKRSAEDQRRLREPVRRARPARQERRGEAKVP